MNNIQRWVAISALALTLAVPAVAAADDMGMMTGKVDYSKADVMMMDGMELVALRPMAESLGYTVTWNDEERSVRLTYGMMDKSMTDKSMMNGGMMDKSMTDKSMMNGGMMDQGMTDKSMMSDGMYTVTIMIGSKAAMVSIKQQMLPYAPVILNSKTYVTKTFVDTYLAGHGMMMK
jgi:hypothetical protein